MLSPETSESESGAEAICWRRSRRRDPDEGSGDSDTVPAAEPAAPVEAGAGAAGRAVLSGSSEGDAEREPKEISEPGGVRSSGSGASGGAGGAGGVEAVGKGAGAFAGAT